MKFRPENFVFVLSWILLAAVVSSAQSNSTGTYDTSFKSGKGLPRQDSSQTEEVNKPVDASAQDSLRIPVRIMPFQPNPKKAGLYSSIVPGLGQFYNKEYWKIPLIYTGAVVAGYFFIKNLNSYNDYRMAYIGRINNPYPNDKYVNIYTTSQLQQLQSDYNKYLDLTVLFSGLGYALQVLDAVTSAHLKNFDVSRDISMKVKPVISPLYNGVALVFYSK